MFDFFFHGISEFCVSGKSSAYKAHCAQWLPVSLNVFATVSVNMGMRAPRVYKTASVAALSLSLHAQLPSSLLPPHYK